MTVAEAIALGAESLRAGSIPTPERESSLLLRHVLNCDAAFIYAHPQHRLNAMESILFKAVIKRRGVHEPYQYIVGLQEFFRLEFRVTPDVLIPRPETEILVEDIIAEFEASSAFRFCEIGVGSGCIAVSLLVNLPKATAVGSDISDAALAVAAQNAERHGVNERLVLVRSDAFDDLPAVKFDLIVSNPPYVPESDLATLQREVMSFEPTVALNGGEDGLNIVRKLVYESPKYLKANGFLFIEIGWDQSERMPALFDSALWGSVDFLPDLQGIPRIVKARLK